MGFENRGPELREYIKHYPGAYNVLYLYEEMANVNEGIAEVLNKLDQLLADKDK